MSDAKRSAGYFGLNSEWAGRVAPPHPEYLISFNNGDCLIEYWKPRAEDTQEPHDRDEVYVLVAGQSEFALGDEQRSVKAGDLIFVPAGMSHKFFNFSDDLAMWIVFLENVMRDLILRRDGVTTNAMALLFASSP